jgi:hypothetical protein
MEAPAVDLVASGAMLADARRNASEPVGHRLATPAGHPLAGLTDPEQGVVSLEASPAHPCPRGCGRNFATRDAANGHGRHYPALAAHKTSGRAPLPAQVPGGSLL